MKGQSLNFEPANSFFAKISIKIKFFDQLNFF